MAVYLKNLCWIAAELRFLRTFSLPGTSWVNARISNFSRESSKIEKRQIVDDLAPITCF